MAGRKVVGWKKGRLQHRQEGKGGGLAGRRAGREGREVGQQGGKAGESAGREGWRVGREEVGSKGT